MAGYGPAVALHEINLSLQAGQRVSLLGANGAGKSSIVNVISGLLPIRSGEVWFEGERIDGRPAHRVVELGIAQIPEGRLIFPKMSVWENLELGSTALRDKEQKDGLLEQVFELFPRLAERRKQLAGTMSGGEQQMLAVGRALMSRPRLILSDEISMGLAPLVVRDIYDTLLSINQEWGVTLLMVEQEAKLALEVADTCHLLESGRIAASGTAEEMSKSELVRKVYLAED
ncbi:MAG: ABC transporter ATP-binding protein [Desulfarculaceae bacterium]|nr:ABC transporter ATP-binding protein [Desulfarculaceae bacterium]MCF8049538.1 ABC transporter ATP-binding protein [Desulfarculaceae bacterium]MCF8063598.1 ABC transporter ATP-binding protein [Desulfarculaceae bacterium]